MVMFPESIPVLVCTHPINLHCSFDGLANATRNLLGQDPRSGQLYVFFNRTRDQVRVLFWDTNGYAVLGKRLERGRFRRPWDRVCEAQNAYELTADELEELLSGLPIFEPQRVPSRPVVSHSVSSGYYHSDE